MEVKRKQSWIVQFHMSLSICVRVCVCEIAKYIFYQMVVRTSQLEAMSFCLTLKTTDHMLYSRVTIGITRQPVSFQ